MVRRASPVRTAARGTALLPPNPSPFLQGPPSPLASSPEPRREAGRVTNAALAPLNARPPPPLGTAAPRRPPGAEDGAAPARPSSRPPSQQPRVPAKGCAARPALGPGSSPARPPLHRQRPGRGSRSSRRIRCGGFPSEAGASSALARGRTREVAPLLTLTGGRWRRRGPGAPAPGPGPGPEPDPEPGGSWRNRRCAPTTSLPRSQQRRG